MWENANELRKIYFHENVQKYYILDRMHENRPPTNSKFVKTKKCAPRFFWFLKKNPRFFENFEFSKCCKTLIYHNVVMPQPKKLYKNREWIKTGCPTRGFLKKTNFAIFLLILIFENFEKSIFWVILPKNPQNGIQNAIFNSIMIVWSKKSFSGRHMIIIKVFVRGNLKKIISLHFAIFKTFLLNLGFLKIFENNHPIIPKSS